MLVEGYLGSWRRLLKRLPGETRQAFEQVAIHAHTFADASGNSPNGQYIQNILLSIALGQYQQLRRLEGADTGADPRMVDHIPPALEVFRYSLRKEDRWYLDELLADLDRMGLPLTDLSSILLAMFVFVSRKTGY